MRLTVAICAYNPDEALLGRVLDAVESQVAAYEDAEALLVDNASAPPLETRPVVRDRPLRVVREPRPGLTAAREAAFAAASGDVVVFCDDDTILADGYLAAVADVFARSPSVGVVGGAVLPEYAAPPPPWLAEFEPQLAIRRYSPALYAETQAPPYTDRFPVGAGMAVRRELALAYVADCRATTRIEGRRGNELSAGEDIDLALYALSQGQAIAVSGALSLTHLIPSERMEPDYVARLEVGSLRSIAALEAKWAPRFGHPVFPALTRPLPSLAARTAAARLLRRRSPRYAIKHARLRAQLAARLGLGG